MPKPILNSAEAAEMLGVTDARIRQMCIDGSLDGVSKFSPRAWLIPLSSAKRLLRKREREQAKKERA
jgi:hypothetical protein